MCEVDEAEEDYCSVTLSLPLMASDIEVPEKLYPAFYTGARA